MFRGKPDVSTNNQQPESISENNPKDFFVMVYKGYRISLRDYGKYSKFITGVDGEPYLRMIAHTDSNKNVQTAHLEFNNLSEIRCYIDMLVIEAKAKQRCS